MAGIWKLLKNLDNFITIGGFDHILGSVNGAVHKKLSKLAFLHMGDNFQPFIYGQTNFPLKMAVQHNISLIMYGENGEVEYGGDMKNAYKIIDIAKSSGADCVKLQTYTPDTLTIDSKLPDFQLTEGLWAGQSLYELYESAFMPWEWHKPLFDYAKKVGITIFSSPFDNTAVDLLEDLNTPAYKIASFEAVDLL
jgi:hypothetical protein